MPNTRGILYQDWVTGLGCLPGEATQHMGHPSGVNHVHGLQYIQVSTRNGAPQNLGGPCHVDHIQYLW